MRFNRMFNMPGERDKFALEIHARGSYLTV